MEQTALRVLNDPRDAEDAVQNAFIKVIGSFEKIFEIPREEVPFWLVCIVKNEALSILRKNMRSEAMEDMDVFKYPTAPVPDYKAFVAYIRKARSPRGGGAGPERYCGGGFPCPSRFWTMAWKTRF